MSVFTFTFMLHGVEVSPELAEQLFDAGCDDALLFSHLGKPHLTFDREAESIEEAIVSAIRNVFDADTGASVAWIRGPEAEFS